MTDFEKMTKKELTQVVTDLQAKVVELEAAPQVLEDQDGVAPGMIQILSLWGTDPQGNAYKDKNGKKFYVGQLNARIYLSGNQFKTPGSRQPDVRGSAMPFRAQDGDGSDVFDDLGQPAEEVEPTPF